jgi:hypothetical protein
MFLSPPVYGQVFFEKKTDGVLIRINEKPFSALHYGKETGKPFLHPLLTVAGGPDPVTRGFPVDPGPGDSTDHPNQRGLSVGAERVNGQDFWDNEPTGPGTWPRDKGTIVFKELTEATDGVERGTLGMLAHWVSHEGKLWLIERRKITFYSKPANTRTLDVEIELEANEPVTFDDHQSAIIGLRLALPFDTHYDGWVVNAAGGLNEPGVRGRRSPWLAWTGITSGGQRMVVAMFDHPSNLNYPTRWQVRDKGFFMANPFGGRTFAPFDATAAKESAEYRMRRGDKLRLRYRILIYPSEREVAPTVATVGELFKEFARQ